MMQAVGKGLRGGILGLLILVLAGIPVRAQEATTAPPEVAVPENRESVRPGINKNFLDPELKVEEWVERFEVESREVFSARNEVLSALELKPGMRVADVGAGTGLYATLFADQVGPEGWVFAVEIAVPFVQHLRDVAREHHQANVTPVLCDEDAIRLPPDLLDLVFTSDVYHHFEYPDKTLASIRSALKPGGRFVVVDFEKIPGVTREWLMEHVRADKQTVKQEVQQAGFEFVGERKIKGFRENYLIVFRKPLK